MLNYVLSITNTEFTKKSQEDSSAKARKIRTMLLAQKNIYYL